MMRRLLAASICVAAVFAAGASAATPAWTPAKVAAALQRMAPLAHTGSVWLPHGFIKAPVCSSSRPGFICAATIQAGASEKVSLWVKPWSASRLCVSRTGRAVCTAPLTASDPRSCGIGTADACLIARAAAAAKAKRPSVIAITCAPAGPLRFTCTGDDTQTVAFTVNGGTWTTTVTP